jgi:uncharacterized protein (TIGR03435 family)
MFTAIQELGLKLEARKVPTQMVTVVRGERPDPN